MAFDWNLDFTPTEPCIFKSIHTNQKETNAQPGGFVRGLLLA